MADTFKPGDVVELKSGGPKMTVTQVGENWGKETVWVAWFDGSKEQHGTFVPEALKIAD